jgi:hypothetical protein
VCGDRGVKEVWRRVLDSLQRRCAVGASIKDLLQLGAVRGTPLLPAPCLLDHQQDPLCEASGERNKTSVSKDGATK